MKQYLFQQVENLSSAQVVQSGHPSLQVSFHCVGLSGARLSVGEAGYFGALEGVLNEGTDAQRVYLLVSRGLVEGVVEIECGLLEILGQVDLLPAWGEGYLCSLTVTCPPGETRTMSDSERCSSLRLRGRLRMATVILGVSANFMLGLNDFC
jgi:hypothetical protein